MKKIFPICILLCAMSLVSHAQSQWFDEKDLTITGVYYYPEHWDESQWERDFKQMSELGFEFVHMAEFAWGHLEPQEGKYDFAWLDKAVSLADKYGLKVIMCTSTATPPVWVSRNYPEIIIRSEDGSIRDHGSRQHASFSSSKYRELAYKMIEELARRYGNDSRIIGWQLDNEPSVQYVYNSENTTKFREFLKKKYGNDINSLNKAWGTAFWSQRYSSFDQINLPLWNQWGSNYHQIMDHRRFAASQTNEFLNDQCLIIKRFAKNQWVTTNYIPNYWEGHIGGSPDMDFLSYTRYMVYGDNNGIGRKGYRVGDPLRISMANDFFRPFSGTYGVMELQPGQVNWGSINPQPLPGAVRLWLWSIFAGGSDLVCTYRYRQPLYGMEQYHYGIVGTDGVTVSPGGNEFIQFIREIELLRQLSESKSNVPDKYEARRAAILYNHENDWNIDNQKQTRLWDTEGHILKYYRSLKTFGAPVDFITEDMDMSGYPLVVIPAYQMADDALVEKWSDYVKNGGHLVISCRTAQKDRNGHLPESKFGAMLTKLTGNEVEFFDTPIPGDPGKVIMQEKGYNWNTWGEILSIAGNSEIWAEYSDEFYAGKPAVTHRKYGKGTVTYIGVDSEEGTLERDILKRVYSDHGIDTMDLPAGVLVEYRNGLGIVLNYTDKPYTFSLPDGAECVIGSEEIPTAGVLVFKI